MILLNVLVVAHKTTIMDFEKTGYAKKLFEADIPRIVHALEGIEKHLNVLVKIKQDEHTDDNQVMGTIQEIFSKRNRKYPEIPGEEKD